MSINDFLILDDNTKELTIQNATRINNPAKGDRRISVYDLGEFFVEVLTDIKKKRISRFRFFRSDLHKDYIGQIDVRP